jgi:hypothetical protein
MAPVTTGQWIGPLQDAYNSACVDVANEGPFDPSIALDRCQQLCAANPKCNAMNYGNPPPNVGCSLRNCPTQSALANPTGGMIPAVHAYYCNTSRVDGFCSAPLSVVLRSAYSDHMVMQHGVASRITGSVPGFSKEKGAKVTVQLDGVVVGTGAVPPSACAVYTPLGNADWNSPPYLQVGSSHHANDAQSCEAMCTKLPKCEVGLFVNGTARNGECCL